MVSNHLAVSALSFGKSALLKSFANSVGMSSGTVYTKQKYLENVVVDEFCLAFGTVDAVHFLKKS